MMQATGQMSKYNLRYITCMEPPRNGNGLLVDYLRPYFGDEWKYCEFYHCCQSIPCVHEESIFQRNHDFELDVDIDPDAHYLLQFRHPLHSMVSHFELRVKLELQSDTRETWIAHAAEWLRFFQVFTGKWIVNNPHGNIWIVTYEEILADPVAAVASVIRYLAPDHEPELERLRTLAESVHLRPIRDPRSFKYYDPLQFALIELEILDLLPQIHQAPQFVPAIQVTDGETAAPLTDLQSTRDYYLLKLEQVEPEVRRRNLWNTQARFKDIVAEKNAAIDRLQETNTRLLKENLELKGVL